MVKVARGFDGIISRFFIPILLASTFLVVSFCGFFVVGFRLCRVKKRLTYPVLSAKLSDGLTVYEME
jgi:hypothetical protein